MSCRQASKTGLNASTTRCRCPGTQRWDAPPWRCSERLCARQSSQILNPGPGVQQQLPGIRRLRILPAPPLGKRPDWRPGREVWVFRALNAALICLIVYFGWVIAWQFTGVGEQMPAPAAEKGPQTADFEAGKTNIGVPLMTEDYKVIWGRNLFGVSAAANPSTMPLIRQPSKK